MDRNKLALPASQTLKCFPRRFCVYIIVNSGGKWENFSSSETLIGIIASKSRHCTRYPGLQFRKFSLNTLRPKRVHYLFVDSHTQYQLGRGKCADVIFREF